MISFYIILPIKWFETEKNYLNRILKKQPILKWLKLNTKILKKKLNINDIQHVFVSIDSLLISEGIDSNLLNMAEQKN